MFEHVDAYPGDPILSLNEDFQRDPRADKINLSIGIYFDGHGRLPVLAAVQAAERAVHRTEAGASSGARPYLPMLGAPEYRRAALALLLGSEHPALLGGRVAGVQTLGGSGALKVGADFLKRYFPTATVHVSDPTWDNHRALFEGAGFPVRTYPYYDDSNDRRGGGVRADAMIETIGALPPQDIVLLHACCHNPTGVDLDRATWQRLIPLLAERRLMAFIDMAYQGFGEGLDDDAWALRELARAGVPTLVASSFSKNMSLYGERVGALALVCADASEAVRVEGQLMAAVRRNYSSPPTHGERIVVQLLGDEALRAQWVTELDAMRQRMQTMRRALRDRLVTRLPTRDFDDLTQQRGMFSYTRLSPAQVDRLRTQHGVYVLRSGRMCVAGLHAGNVGKVADAMASVLTD